MEQLGGLSTTDEQIQLPPGFRFHPTDEELITHYLSPKLLNNNFTTTVVGEVDLNKVEPWDLPWKAKMGEKECYFFCVRDKKYSSGSRTNRATEGGYWKATGKDREIYRGKILVGMKKTLVFYGGRAPRGEKTSWVMHEYRLQERTNSMHNHGNFKTAKKEWVICRIFNKNLGGERDENQKMIAEGPHATCFSNPVQNHLDNSTEQFSSSSKNILCDYPVVPFTFSHDYGQRIGADAHTSSYHEVGFKPYADDDQGFPVMSTSDVDFGCLWDY